MISAALSMALVVGTALNTGDADDAGASTNNQVIDIRIDSDAFLAVNSTHHDHLLVFGFNEARFVRALPAGASLAWPIPHGGTEGVTLELLSLKPNGLTTTREFSIDLGVLTAGRPMFLTANTAGITAWTGAPGPPSNAPVNAASAGSASSSSTGFRSSYFYSSSTGTNAGAQIQEALFHVPSVSGLDNSGIQAPPMLDEAPLPMI